MVLLLLVDVFFVTAAFLFPALAVVFVSVRLLFFDVFSVVVFFLLSDAFARCVVLCTAEPRVCSEALANGVKVNVVNNKAQSVIEAV